MLRFLPSPSLLRTKMVFFSLLSTGAMAQDASQTPTVTQFDDWYLRCVAKDSGSENQPIDGSCEIAQSIEIDDQGKKVSILNIALSKASDKAGKVDYALVVLTPLDVDLRPQFGLQFGKGKQYVTAYRNCNHLGCWVIVPADDKIIDRMKKANTGFARFRLLNQRTVSVSFSLKGFTKAFSELAARQSKSNDQS